MRNLVLITLCACTQHATPAEPDAPGATPDAVADAPGLSGGAPYFPCWGDVANTAACTPLVDMGASTLHLGKFQGGLYPGGGNTPPDAHLAVGLAQANAVVPLDIAGNPSATGKYLFITVGFSNQKYEFCGRELAFADQCDPWTVAGRMVADSTIDPHLVFFNGAQGGHVVQDWDEPSDVSWTSVANALQNRGYSEAQVQVIALQVTFMHHAGDLSLRDTLKTCAQDPSPDACKLEQGYGNILRAARAHYPNLKIVLLNSRTYGGWTKPAETSAGNPEPFAYESGFAMKWTIEAQIAQESTGTVDPIAGNLGPANAAWIDWSVYNWANAPNVPARSDGLSWPQSHFDPDDGIHETPHNAMPRTCETDSTGDYACGEAIAAKPLFEFYKTDRVTRCWFTNTTAACQ